MKHTYPILGLGRRATRWLAGIGLSLLAPVLAHAQVSTYSVTQGTTTWTPLTTATADETRGSTTGSDDDTNWGNISIGFNFTYNDTTTNQVGISNNCVMVMGPNSSWGYTQISNSTSENSGVALSSDGPSGQSNMVTPFAGDYKPSVGQEPILIKRAGTPGNRTFTVQWTKEKRYNTWNQSNGASTEEATFQVILHEGTNKIEFVYGPIIKDPTYPFATMPQIGIRGNNKNDFNARQGNSLAGTSRASANTDQVNVWGGTLPTEGTLYTFTPIPPAPNDLGVIAIISPRRDQTTCLLTAQEPVKVVIRNFGSHAQASAPVSYSVNSGQTQNKTVQYGIDSLRPGMTDTITFSGVQGANMTTAGTYVFTARTSLATELPANQANDIISGYTVTLSGALNTRPYPYQTLGAILATPTSAPDSGRWSVAEGRLLPFGNTSDWTTGYPYNSETIAIVMDQTGNRQQQEWLLSPNYNVNANHFLIFKAGTTINSSGPGIVASVGDDTLKVMVSNDCGNTWRTIKRFSNVDVAAGNLNYDDVAGNFHEFRVPINNVGSPIRIAFYVTNNGTNAPATYRWHLDDIQIKELLPHDMGVTALLKPVAGTPGCALSTQEDVTVVVKNYGTQAQTSDLVAYRLGTRTVQQTFTFSSNGPGGSLLPGNMDTVTFSGTNGADLSVPGSYNFVAYTIVASETAEGHRNDTLKAAPVQISNPLALPSVLITGSGDLNTNRWAKGTGVSRPTGATSRWGFGSLNGNASVSITMDTTDGARNDWFYSPNYQGSPTSFLTFKMAIVAAGNFDPAPNGLEDDTLTVLISNDCGSSWTRVVSISQADVTAGTISNTMTQFNYRVSTVTQRIMVGFRMSNHGTASQAQYRVMMDDIQLYNAILNDAGALTAIAPIGSTYGCAPGSIQPSVTIRNYGADPISSVVVQYIVDNGTPVSETFTFNPPIASGANGTVTFSVANAVTLTAGTHRIQFKTQLANDTQTANDTLRTLVLVYDAAQTVPAGTQLSEAFTAANPGELPVGWHNASSRFGDFFVRATNVGGDQQQVLRATFWRNMAVSWATTPQWVLPTDTASTHLSFAYRVREAARGTATVLGGRDTIDVDVSTDCGHTWTNRYRIRNTNHVTNSQFKYVDLSLGNYAGQTVIVRFRAHLYRADGVIANGANLDIDSVNIGSGIVATAPLSATQLNLYPNPSTGRVILERAIGGLASVEIVDGLGRVQATHQLTSAAEEINLSALPKGFYTLVVRDANGLSRKRLVLE